MPFLCFSVLVDMISNAFQTMKLCSLWKLLICIHSGMEWFTFKMVIFSKAEYASLWAGLSAWGKLSEASGGGQLFSDPIILVYRVTNT